MIKKFRTFRILTSLVCLMTLVIIPAQAFTADSLDITVHENGDATAAFQFTLEGFLENAIPQSMLQDELIKGLSTSSEPPTLISMDRSSAIILMKQFSRVSDVPTGTGYITASMNFKKAEIALQESALSSVVTADFSPAEISVTFPDNYERRFVNIDALPSITHTIVDPAKAVANGSATPQKGSIAVTTSPEQVRVMINNAYAGDSPATFDELVPGEYTVTFQKDGFVPETKTVVVEAGNTTRVSAYLKYVTPSASTTGTPKSSGFGIVAALLGSLCCAGIWLMRK